MELSLNSYYSFRTPSQPHRRRRRRRTAVAATASGESEIRVCVNRSCSRQGSREVLEALSGLAPPSVSVASCGCLGRCGAGPNLVILPAGAIVGHCATPACAAQLLADLIGPRFDPKRNLDALALRKAGEAELESGSASNAEALFSEAIDLRPSGGLHLIYKSRSAARLSMGYNAGALEDAGEACRMAPKYPQAYICQGDVFLAMEDFDAAEESYSTALQIDPSIRRSKSFKARVAKLQEKLVTPKSAS